MDVKKLLLKFKQYIKIAITRIVGILIPVAILFMYLIASGAMQDFIEGPFDQMIKTANLPVLSSIIGLAYDGGTPFQAEVYFINTTVRWCYPFVVIDF